MPVGIFGKDIVNYRSSKEGADKVVADIRADGGRAIAVRADVGKYAEVQALFDEAKKPFGKVDILVNNAGVYRFDPTRAKRSCPSPVLYHAALRL